MWFISIGSLIQLKQFASESFRTSDKLSIYDTLIIVFYLQLAYNMYLTYHMHK
jgi:hypothetical protein